jgi:dolichol-phosphate mannosyltransferase
MSGFFAVRKAAVDVQRLQPRGFKILLEILGRSRGLRVAEVPFTFATRHDGESKASGREAARFIGLLLGLRFGVSAGVARAARFALTGASGMVVNLAVLALLLSVHPASRGATWHAVAEFAATQVAVLWNFLLTETWVFRGQKRGRPAVRFAGFWLVNLLSLGLQLPLAQAITVVSRVGYVTATAIALAVLVVVRYAICRVVLFRPAAEPLR